MVHDLWDNFDQILIRCAQKHRWKNFAKKPEQLRDIHTITEGL